jgi:Mg2+ and Co2+ transporter CorA
MLVTFPVDRPSESTQGDKQSWFDLFDPTQDERASVERATGLKLPTREQLSEVESSSRVSIDNGVLYLSVPGVIHIDDAEEMPAPVGFHSHRSHSSPSAMHASILQPGDREAASGWRGRNERRDIHAAG